MDFSIKLEIIRPKLTQWLAKYVSIKEDREDIVADTIIIAWQRSEELQEYDDLKLENWCRTVARNKKNTEYQQKKRGPDFIPIDAVGPEGLEDTNSRTPEDIVVAEDWIKFISLELDEWEKKAVELLIIGCSEEDTAERSGLTRSQVKCLKGRLREGRYKRDVRGRKPPNRID